MSTDPKKNEEVKEENLDEVAGGRKPPIAAPGEDELGDAGNDPSRPSNPTILAD